ncbi:MAG: hypothetical protein WCO69_01235 [Candidatus Omnitrophota bacterium]
MHCRFRLSNKGVSFPEVLIAVGILGFALTGLLNGMVTTINLNRVTRNTSLALTHAEYVLESIRSTPYMSITSDINTGRWTMKEKEIKDEGLVPLINESITTAYSGSGPLTVTVVVKWEDTGGRKRNIELTTIEAGL